MVYRLRPHNPITLSDPERGAVDREAAGRIAAGEFEVAWYPARAFADVESPSVVISINDFDAFAFEADHLRTEIDRTSFFCFVEVLPDRLDRAFEVGVSAWGPHISEFGKRDDHPRFP